MANTPFKLRSGNSPLKETKDWFNVRGYLKGEQGLIPDWKGEKTTTTASKVSKNIQSKYKKGTTKLVKGAKKLKDWATSDDPFNRRSGMSKEAYEMHMRDKRGAEGDKSFWRK